MAVEPLLGSRAQKAFIATITIQAIVVIVLIAVVFRLVDEQVALRHGFLTLPCYLALFGLGELFELFMAFDALRLRNVVQLFGILIFHVALTLFAALQIHQTKTALVGQINCVLDPTHSRCSLWETIKPMLIAAPCVIGGSWLLMLFWVKQLYAEFGWAIFHVVGANPKMKAMYQWYQIMVCLLKFDFFFFAGVTMQLLILVLQANSAEFGITIIAIPIVLVLLVLCAYAVQREIKWIMSISLFLMVAASSYLYKLVRFYQPGSREQYETTRATLTVFTIFAFVLLISTFAVGIRCFADFDQGLVSSKVNSVPSRPLMHNAPSSGNMSQKHGEAGVPPPRLVIE